MLPMTDIFNVKLSRNAIKNLKKVPAYIVIKMQSWIDDIKHNGLSKVKTITGYHDEPLKGKRAGQRSIRLSKSYRAIYVIEKECRIKFIEIIEVNKHEY